MGRICGCGFFIKYSAGTPFENTCGRGAGVDILFVGVECVWVADAFRLWGGAGRIFGP